MAYYEIYHTLFFNAQQLFDLFCDPWSHNFVKKLKLSQRLKVKFIRKHIEFLPRHRQINFLCFLKLLPIILSINNYWLLNFLVLLILRFLVLENI